MKPCRGCGVRHASAGEARQCFARRRDRHLDPVRAARRREEYHDNVERQDPFADGILTRGESFEAREARMERVEREQQRREARTTAGRAGDQYRSAESQAFSSAQRRIEADAEEGVSLDGIKESDSSLALEDFLRDAKAVLEDVEVFTDDTWVIADDRVRTSEQSAFNLREDQEPPPVSPWDIDHPASAFWHANDCEGRCCRASQAMSWAWEEYAEPRAIQMRLAI
jgi:hypothetical protein